MTRYIAAYDTESPACLEACRAIVKRHRQHDMPATFFITGKTLEADPAEYRGLLDDPLFEIASHTYSHRMLRDHPLCGDAADADGRRVEVMQGKEWVEKVFERPCIGLRPGCSFVDGLKGAPDVLSLIREAGLQYVSSVAWGKEHTMPAPLTQPFRYSEDGFSEIWEIPCHGWHENLLKDHNKWGPRAITLWPAPWPEAIPAGFVRSAGDEFAVNRVFMDRAASDEMEFVSLIWHPWSLAKFDPEMDMLDLTFSHVRDLGLEPTTYAGMCESLTASA